MFARLSAPITSVKSLSGSLSFRASSVLIVYCGAGIPSSMSSAFTFSPDLLTALHAASNLSLALSALILSFSGFFGETIRYTLSKSISAVRYLIMALCPIWRGLNDPGYTAIFILMEFVVSGFTPEIPAFAASGLRV